MHKAPGLLSSMQGVVGRDSTRAGEVTQWAEGLASKHQVLGLTPGIENKWCATAGLESQPSVGEGRVIGSSRSSLAT